MKKIAILARKNSCKKSLEFRMMKHRGTEHGEQILFVFSVPLWFKNKI